MDKIKFDTMALNEQLDYINSRLLNESMRAISTDLGIHKNTIPTLFTRNGYIFSKETKQYIKNEVLNDSQAKEPVTKPVLVNSQDHRPKFNIPLKTKDKIETKAFNLVMRKNLVKKLDKLCIDKGGYSRNELINIMCEYCINNME